MKNLQVRDRKPVAMRILSGDTEHIDGIILTGSVGIRAKDLHAIVRERVLIEKKFQAASMGYHELKRQIREIMRTLEAAALVNASDPLPEYLAEGTFAALYFLNEEDLISDTVPGIGLTDDAILVKRVVARYGRELVRSGCDY